MNVLVLGGTSEIGLAIAHAFAKEHGASVTLASRDMEALGRLARDLEIRHGVNARAAYFDALDYASHKGFYDSLPERPDVVVAAFGFLGEQESAQSDFAQARLILETNYLGMASILEIVAADFEARKGGTIIGLSSVAGLRGRRSNYHYGAAKAALTTLLSGLRHRLHASGARVVTVLPGFVRTRMTEGLDLPEKLTSEPGDVAADVMAAFEKKRAVVYSRWYWRLIMLVVRFLPEFLFVRTKL